MQPLSAGLNHQVAAQNAADVPESNWGSLAACGSTALSRCARAVLLSRIELADAKANRLSTTPVNRTRRAKHRVGKEA